MMRSQIAEALYKKYKDNNAFSAGIFPIIEHHAGKKLKDLKNEGIIISAMKNQEGIDLSENICKELNEEMVQKADKIIVMISEEMYPDFLSIRKDLIVWNIKNEFTNTLIDEIKEKVLKLT